MPLAEKPRRPAALPVAAQRRREALVLVKPFTSSIGKWQVRVARLRGLVDQPQPISLAERETLEHQAEALRAEVAEQRDAFEVARDAAPIGVKTHDILDDTAKAIANAAATVDRVIALLTQVGGT